MEYYSTMNNNKAMIDATKKRGGEDELLLYVTVCMKPENNELKKPDKKATKVQGHKINQWCQGSRGEMEGECRLMDIES